MIKQFRHKGLQHFFETGSKAGIQAAHASKLRRQLARLDLAAFPQDMNLPGWKLHPLSADLAGHWAIWVSGNWRLTFRFEAEDAVLVDYRDYGLNHRSGPPSLESKASALDRQDQG